MNFNDTDASICNEDGELLFYFNGIYIEDTENNTILNGDTLNEWNNTGYDLPQGGLILPFPGRNNLYILFHAEEGYIDLPGRSLECIGIYYSVIDIEKNNGLGTVIQRKVPLVIDTLEYGKITGVKHANGRDWWIVLNRSYSNEYYKILVTNNGIEDISVQEIGENTPLGLGQAVFSPDGSKYVKFNTIDTQNGSYLDIYDFDRCTGILSNHQQFNFNDYTLSSGLSISPNSRFLYVMTLEYVYQFDLFSDSIFTSKEIVAKYDGFQDPFPTKFYQAQLSLNGKIYFATSSGSKYLHVIHNPNTKGVDCKIQQHGLRLPTYNGNSIPNFVNYRLGSLDGSACDTLGIDNVPLALFRNEPSEINMFEYGFVDLSTYEPTSWEWTIDGEVFSNAVNPTVTFAGSDVYEICLTVSNIYGEDKVCKDIYVGTTAFNDDQVNLDISMTVDINSKQLFFTLPNLLEGVPKLYIYDIGGRLIRYDDLTSGQNNISLNELASSVYFYTVRENNRVIKSGKLVLIF